MNYRKRLVEALDRTEKLGLKLDFSPLPLTADLPIDVKQNIFQLCAEALNHYGYVTSSDLASKCTPVHLMLQSHLKSDLNIDSYITIGDRYWDDYIYCEMSDESINKELESTNIHEPIKAHVWLTLSDGTILDCTAEAHADLLFKRGEHPAHKCIMLIDPKQPEDAKTGYHRPFILGSAFLKKTGMVQLGYL
ncbi:hypothetical protein CWC28_10735 [Pseudoalteromonas sp. S4492]|uniref:hypothetical protein n=1 Tax=Pseudoalteromonas sp. S4492 TaxID=579560 RepID=UPI00110AF47C|nr:hypothetical protein [Pseudoalteromonas sp. S4492]TMO27371.1 hypothetical protein CWC28_10735 [Pseudoalteromonas sp. S4492]